MTGPGSGANSIPDGPAGQHGFYAEAFGTPSLFVQPEIPWYNFSQFMHRSLRSGRCRKNLPLGDLPVNIDWRKGDATIRWEGARVTLPACVDNVLACSTEPRILALYGDSIPTLRLAAFDSSGELVLDLMPPPNRHFYYLSHHVNHEHAVVCISTENELDWFFAVDAASRSLVSLDRAY